MASVRAKEMATVRATSMANAGTKKWLAKVTVIGILWGPHLPQKGLVSEDTFMVPFPMIHGEPYCVCIANGTCNFYFWVKITCIKSWMDSQFTQTVLHIDSCHYTTNLNTVDCISVIQIL